MNDLTSFVDGPIGVFDSGVGGLSVLRHIRAQLPSEHLMYFADTAFAPYGDKPEETVRGRVMAVAEFLVGKGAKALVVACNTATIAAVRCMRDRFPGLPIVGVEPGLKPAAAASKTGVIGVLATERTLKGEKFWRLHDRIARDTGARFVLQACVGLADQIETGELSSEATTALLTQYITPLLDQGVDTLVLGCTHYPLVQPAIQSVVERYTSRDVVLVDTGGAVARHVRHLLDEVGLLRTQVKSPATLAAYTSARPGTLSAAFASLLGFEGVEVQAIQSF